MEKIFDKLKKGMFLRTLKFVALGICWRGSRTIIAKPLSGKVKDKVKLSTYNLLKSGFGTEEYIKLNLDHST